MLCWCEECEDYDKNSKGNCREFGDARSCRVAYSVSFLVREVRRLRKIVENN